jgi:hypothetical protein
MCRRIFLAVLALLAMLGATSPLAAQGRYPYGRYYSNVMPLDRILPGIRTGHPGRFYDAEGPFPDGVGGYRYRIKWLTPDGRVVWFDTDAQTGRIVGTARSDWRAGPPAPPPPNFGYNGARGGPYGYGVRPGAPYGGPARNGGWGGRGGWSGRGGPGHPR